MSKYSSCGCGETSQRVAVMNRTTSKYLWGRIPTHEIEQVISWLNQMKSDINYRIAELEGLRQYRERSKEWRDNINDLAHHFMDDMYLNHDEQMLYKSIKQRLGTPPHITRHIAGNVKSWIKKRKKQIRNEKICLAYRTGKKPHKIAKKHKISRQQVHNIVRADATNKFM
jgi:hypothetical protein